MLRFLDSAIVIYLVEQTPAWSAKATQKVSAWLTAGDNIVVSDLIRMECLIGPLKRRDAALQTRFDRFFQARGTLVAPITSSICDRAAQVRADHGFKPLDALHLAAAIESGCHSLLTNDLRLARFTGLTVETLA